jgi:hypothetical protein
VSEKTVSLACVPRPGFLSAGSPAALLPVSQAIFRAAVLTHREGFPIFGCRAAGLLKLKSKHRPAFNIPGTALAAQKNPPRCDMVNEALNMRADILSAVAPCDGRA